MIKTSIRKIYKKYYKLNDKGKLGFETAKFIFEKFKDTSKQSILIKFCVLNQLYGTSIYDFEAVVNKLFELKDFEKRASEGDINLIEDLRKIHLGKDKKEYDCYSFATKYCHFHNPEKFPIFDSRVELALKRLKKEKLIDEFKGSLRDYSNFCDVFRKILETLKENPDDVDHFLWQFGKRIIEKNKKDKK